MQSVEIENVKPGMILANDVKNDRGMVLLPRGSELTDQLIARLENSGVESISIQNAGGGQDEFEKKKAVLDQRFSLVMSIPIMVELHDLMVQRLKTECGVE